MKKERRKLIKFSNYSLCVTLPKWVIKELNWKKGEVVDMEVDSDSGTILITKGKKSNIPKSNEKENKRSENYSRW